jgi:murein DD-endopeptidase MepM/ murein hydrolase activator NlpD
LKKKKRKSHRFEIIHLRTIKILTFGVLVLLVSFSLFVLDILPSNLPALQSKSEETIKWVDFDVPYNALEKAMNLDIETYNSDNHLIWTELLAYLGAKYGGNFKQYKDKDLDNLVEKLNNGEMIAHLTKDMKYYNYYDKAYTAILGGFLGEYKIQIPTEANNDSSQSQNTDKNISADQTSSLEWQTKYGLKAFSPIAQGYWYNDYDDFGAGRSYGYDRKHFGHDLMVSIGTPIIAIESGIVEATGWNQYGGWRIGIRSYDKKRYYYYAHLRKDRPYSANLYIGKAVEAGEVIGYSGRTGYSAKENVNNIDTPHLHVGMQLIFDEKLKDSPNQIWIDLYSITRLLSKNKSPVYKNEETMEYYRKYDFSEMQVRSNDNSNL